MGRSACTPINRCAFACVVDFFGPTDFLQMQPTAVEGAVLNHNAMQSPESLLPNSVAQAGWPNTERRS